MKSVFIAIIHFLIQVWVCQPISAFAQDSAVQAGSYWINVVQTGQSSYLLNVTIAAKEDLEVRTMRVPTLIDFSELPTKETIPSGKETTVGFPVKFTSEGRESLWISIHNQKDADKVCYLVFELFNEVRGDQVRPEVEATASRWKTFGGSESVMQFGRTATRCGGNLASAVADSGIFNSRNAVSGVMLKGITSKSEGSIGSFDTSGWGLKFVADKQLRVGTFYSARELHAERAENNTQATGEQANNEHPEQKPDQQTEHEAAKESENTSNSQVVTNTSNRTDSGRSSDRRTQPVTGPFSGSGAIAKIENLSVNKAWSPESQGGGHFGETLVKLPQEASRLKTIEQIELTLQIKPRGTGSGKGRVFISTKRTLPSGSPAGEASFWFADHFDQQGYFLGEFDTEFGSPDYSFDITNWAKSHRADAYYVSILNLSRVPLDIENIRLSLKGVR